MKEGYEWWRQHDLDRADLDEAQTAFSENEAAWLCAHCEDAGGRNGRQLAYMAADRKKHIHQIGCKIT